MSLTDDEKDMRIKEQAATIRLLTDLTEAGSWVINFAPDGSLTSVQWGDGFRRLMGYSDQNDFPNAFDSFLRGIYPEDRDAFPLWQKRLPVFLTITFCPQRAMISALSKKTQSAGSAAGECCPVIPRADRYSTGA